MANQRAAQTQRANRSLVSHARSLGAATALRGPLAPVAPNRTKGSRQGGCVGGMQSARRQPARPSDKSFDASRLPSSPASALDRNASWLRRLPALANQSIDINWSPSHYLFNLITTTERQHGPRATQCLDSDLEPAATVPAPVSAAAALNTTAEATTAGPNCASQATQSEQVRQALLHLLQEERRGLRLLQQPHTSRREQSSPMPSTRQVPVSQL